MNVEATACVGSVFLCVMGTFIQSAVTQKTRTKKILIQTSRFQAKSFLMSASVVEWEYRSNDDLRDLITKQRSDLHFNLLIHCNPSLSRRDVTLWRLRVNQVRPQKSFNVEIYSSSQENLYIQENRREQLQVFKCFRC